MANWFAGIGQASSGLVAAQYGLSVVSQNITNEATPGYTRQVSNQAAIDGSMSSGLFAGRSGMGGVTVVSTSRTADAVLDARVRTEHAFGGVADASATALAAVEQVFPEPTDQGLSAQIGAIWSSFGNVANNPGDAGTRTVLLKAAQTVAGTLNTMSNSLSNLTASTSSYLSNDVTSANSSARQLAQLNGQITVTAATGGNTNALLDTRDRLLDSLSKSVGGIASINANGTADVSVGGQPMVTNNPISMSSLFVDPASYEVSVGGNTVSLTGGTAAGEIGALLTTIPRYTVQLNAVADSLVATINGVQAAGNDLSGTAGEEMLTGTGAAGITVVMTDGSKIAAASSTGGILDNGNARAAADLGASSTGPDASYASLVGDVAANSALAQQQQSTQATVVASVSALQTSISGVDENEEITNMLTYQHAFSAASRVLTTLDSVLDTLINHTGLVGRA